MLCFMVPQLTLVLLKPGSPSIVKPKHFPTFVKMGNLNIFHSNLYHNFGKGLYECWIL